jgi:hypothetical protein
MRRRAARLRQCWHALERAGVPVSDPLLLAMTRANDAEVALAELCEGLVRKAGGYRPLVTQSFKTSGLAAKERADFAARGIRRG